MPFELYVEIPSPSHSLDENSPLSSPTDPKLDPELRVAPPCPPPTPKLTDLELETGFMPIDPEITPEITPQELTYHNLNRMLNPTVSGSIPLDSTPGAWTDEIEIPTDPNISPAMTFTPMSSNLEKCLDRHFAIDDLDEPHQRTDLDKLNVLNRRLEAEQNAIKTYRHAAKKAKQKYIDKAPRYGLKPTFLSRWRHSHKCYQAIDDLITDLAKCYTTRQAEDVIGKHIDEARGNYNNHSFKTYLLDELIRAQKLGNIDPRIDWNDYHKRPVIYYTGTLYRGDMRNPTDIFRNGFKPRQEEVKLKGCIANRTGNNGISTSKSKFVAQQYTDNTKCYFDALPVVIKGYLYEIDYRGSDAIDVAPTLRCRSSLKPWPLSNIWNGISWTFSKDKEEVIVVGQGIRREDIIRCWDFTKPNAKGEPTLMRNKSYYKRDSVRISSPINSDSYSDKCFSPR